MQTSAFSSSWHLDLFLLILLLPLIFGLQLGAIPLQVPDEARYAEIPREMISNHNFIIPRLNNVVYLEKPALFYWLEVFSIKTFGFKPWSIRIPNALFAWFGCIFIYMTGKKLYNRQTGLFSSLILASSVLYLALSHIVVLDMTLSFFLTSALLVFLMSVREGNPRKNSKMIFTFYVFTGLAVMTKGLIGILLPFLIIASWAFAIGEWNEIKKLLQPLGILTFFLIIIPWHLAVQLKFHNFLYFYLVEQHFFRYLTLSASRYKPIWWFLPIILLGFFPWTAFLIPAIRHHFQSIRKNFSEKKHILFLFLWVLIIFIFYSLSDSKLAPYILPIFPPLALLVGNYFAQSWQTAITREIKIIYYLLPAIAFLASVFIILFAKTMDFPNPVMAIRCLLLISFIIMLFMLFAFICIQRIEKLRGPFSGTVTSLSSTGKTPERKYFLFAFLSLAFSSIISFYIFYTHIAFFDDRSIKDLALIIQKKSKPGDDVVSYRNYYQDLAIYLRHPIVVVDWQGELSQGMTLENTQAWMMTGKIFWENWHSSKRIFMILDSKVYQNLQNSHYEPLIVVARTSSDILLTNHEL